MRAVVTRVSSASVAIGGQVRGQIEQGFLVLLGVGPNDTEETAVKLAEKICRLRVFSDENGKMNRDLAAVGGALLVVSQFTLYADTKSRRPGFTGAASRTSPQRCMSVLWKPARRRVSPSNTANSARICKSNRSTTAR